MINEADDISRHVTRAVGTRVMGLVARAMAPEVETDDLEPESDEFLGPPERGIVSLETDRPSVQEDQRPARSMDLEVQPNVAAIEGWQ